MVINKSKMGLAILLGLTLMACENLFTSDEQVTFETPQYALLSKDLGTQLDLSTERQFQLDLGLREGERKHRNPGHLWVAAARLQSTLTSEEKDSLFALLTTDVFLFARNGRMLPSGESMGIGPRRHGPGHHRGGSRERPPLDMLEIFEGDSVTLAAFQDILETYHDEIRDLMEKRRSGEITDEEFREQMQALQDARKTELEALLTEEQLAALKALRDQQRDAWQARMMEHHAAVWAVIEDVLELTSEQSASLLEFHETYRQTLSDLRDKVRAGELEHQELIETVQQLSLALNEEIKSILDERQYEIVLIHKALSLRMIRNKNFPGMRGHPFKG